MHALIQSRSLRFGIAIVPWYYKSNKLKTESIHLSYGCKMKHPSASQSFCFRDNSFTPQLNDSTMKSWKAINMQHLMSNMIFLSIRLNFFLARSANCIFNMTSSPASSFLCHLFILRYISGPARRFFVFLILSWSFSVIHLALCKTYLRILYCPYLHFEM